MGRASRAVAEQHHEQLIEVAARLFREREAAEVSVPVVMGEIGLTRGGFYKHFESKDALWAAAIDAVFEQHLARIAALADDNDGDPAATRSAFVEFCLSAGHRDDPGSGCPASLASAMSHCESDSAPRMAYVDGMRAVIGELTARTSGGAGARGRLLAEIAMLTGAVLLARALTGDPLSDEILAAARSRLLDATSVG